MKAGTFPPASYLPERMPNKNYERGRRKEYYIRDKFRQQGFIAFRSAGSHSPIDVVAINTFMKKIVLIQCKPKSMSENAKKKLEEENITLNGIFDVNFKVV